MKSKNTYIVEWDEVHHHRLAVLAKDAKEAQGLCESIREESMKKTPVIDTGTFGGFKNWRILRQF